MKKLSQILGIVLIAGLFASCQTDPKANLEGNWNVDSVYTGDAQAYAKFMAEEGLKQYEQRKAQLQSILDTVTDEDTKSQIEAALQQNEMQKAQYSAEELEKRIKEQDSQSKDQIKMSFAADSSLYILSKNNDTTQKATYEMTEEAIIMHFNMRGQSSSDTLRIESLENGKMLLVQEQDLSDEFTIQRFFQMTKKEEEAK